MKNYIQSIFGIGLGSLMLIACQSNKSHEQTAESIPVEPINIEEKLAGLWRNTTLTVIANRTNPDEKKWNVMMECHADNWEEQTNMKPIRTRFDPDGSWKSEYRNLDDSIFRVTSGKWTVMGDSLIMEQTVPDSSFKTGYHVTISGNSATFKGYLDWDNDGEKDDLYEGTQEKIGPA
jgi:hypothetical protein